LGQIKSDIEMKKPIKYFILTSWLIFFSMAFAGIWLRNPSIWFISIPDTMRDFLMDAFNAHCCESVADLEFAVTHVFGLIFASIIVALFYFMKKTMRKHFHCFLMMLWLVFASFFFATAWLATPLLWPINLPEAAWIFLMDAFNATCCESSADLVEVVALFFGFILAIIVLVSFVFIKNKIKANKLQQLAFNHYLELTPDVPAQINQTAGKQP